MIHSRETLPKWEDLQPKSVDTTPPTSSQDPTLYRVVVGGLVALALLALAGIFALSALSLPPNDGLVALGSAAAGGLVGLLAPSPTK